jgi:hypothetical protein
LALLALLSAAPGGAQTPSVRNVSNTTTRAEAEESVAVNPANGANLIVGSNQYETLSSSTGLAPGPSGTITCAAWVTHDGGQTWSGGSMSASGPAVPAPVPAPLTALGLPGEFSQPGNILSADQNTVFDRRGNAWFDCIDYGVGTGEALVHVWHSGDGGRTWEAPVTAVSGLRSQVLIDRPFLAIDQSGGPRDGWLYVGYETQFFQPLLPAVYAVSSGDGGKTWSPQVRVDTDAQRALWDAREFPAVDADGTLDIAYAAGDASPSITLMVGQSRDGGRTFSNVVAEAAAHRVASPDEAEDTFSEIISALAADPARPGRLALAWPDGRSGESRILLRSTTDGGRTWSAPVDVADDPPGRGNQHDHVALAYLPDGRVAVVWRDRRYSDGAFKSPFDVFARAVEVSGARPVPGPTARVTESSQPWTFAQRGVEPSEYLGAAAGPDGLAVAWDQVAGPYTDNVFRRLPLSAFAPGSPPPPPAPASRGGHLPATGGPGRLSALGALALLAALTLTRTLKGYVAHSPATLQSSG